MEYTFRTLNSKDIFLMSKILSKIGLKEFKESFNFDNDTIKKLTSGKAENVDAVGMAVMLDIAGIILSHLGDCEKDIFMFLSSVTGLKVKEIEEASMAEFAEMVISLVKKDEFKDFIKVVSGLFN